MALTFWGTLSSKKNTVTLFGNLSDLMALQIDVSTLFFISPRGQGTNDPSLEPVSKDIYIYRLKRKEAVQFFFGMHVDLALWYIPIMVC